MSTTASPSVSIQTSPNPLADHSWFFRLRYRAFMLWSLFFNLPAFWNLWMGLKIAKQARGRVLGWEKSLYLYPILPFGAVAQGLHYWGVIPDATMGLCWMSLVILCVCTGVENLKGRYLVAAFGVIFGTVGVLVALRYAFDWDILGVLDRFISWFGITYVPGHVWFLMFLVFVGFILSFIRSYASDSILFFGNLMRPMRLHKTTPYSYSDHRLVSVVGDWAEVFTMGARDFVITTIFARGMEGNSGDVEDNAVYKVSNVPAAALVEEIVFTRMATQDVEPA